MYPIYAFGSEEQKQKWLPAMALGEKLGCFGLTEPDSGSNPGGMRTRARKDGNEYVLNGEKMWITSGSIADIAIIWAKVEDEDNRIRGFIVETDRPGFRAADVHGKWSLRASVTSSLSLQDVRIPAENLLPQSRRLEVSAELPEPGALWHRLGRHRRGHGLLRLRAAIFAVPQAVPRQPIASHQLVQEKLVWMISEITKAQLLALQVGRLKDAGKVKHAAHLDGQAEQRLDGAGVRAHGPRHSGRQRYRRRVSNLPPHGEPGVGEDL